MKLADWVHKSPIVKNAYHFAKKAHQGQKRKTGEPYFNHCAATAEIVAEWKLDEVSIAAALLHDVVEDTGTPLSKIETDFSQEVAFLVDGVTKVGHLKYRGTELELENFRKFILYLSQDIRVLLIKLADRLNNMQTLYALPTIKQRRIALETMEVYAPLAYRFGMQKISGELEDLAFPYLYPAEYKWLLENTKEHYLERERYLDRSTPYMESLLKNAGLENFKVIYRSKRYTSLYKKLLRYDMDIKSIYDLVALRIITENIEDCYKVLGLVHQHFQPLPQRFKDYIAMPKTNGYKSLHTTVFGPENKILEVQIKTKQMHEDAEYGIASHIAYQETKGKKAYAKHQTSFASLKELTWLKQIREWQTKFNEGENSIESLKIDFFKDRIFAITPKGDVFDLPVGSTPIDFAFKVHSDIGAHCAGAKVNGKMVPLSHELQSGDLVEIITKKNQRPSRDWLAIATTSDAKKKIRTFLGKDSGSSAQSKEVKAQKEYKMALIAGDRVGLLKDVTKIISENNINIKSLKTESMKLKGLTRLVIILDTISKEKLDFLMQKIRKIPGVRKIDY